MKAYQKLIKQISPTHTPGKKTLDSIVISIFHNHLFLFRFFADLSLVVTCFASFCFCSCFWHGFSSFFSFFFSLFSPSLLIFQKQKKLTWIKWITTNCRTIIPRSPRGYDRPINQLSVDHVFLPDRRTNEPNKQTTKQSIISLWMNVPARNGVIAFINAPYYC